MAKGYYYRRGNRGTVSKKRKNTEDKEQTQLINQLRSEYPNLLILGDIAGSYLLPSQREAAYDNRSGRGMPDIYIFTRKLGYTGLAIEFKKTGKKIKRKDGKLLKNEHLSNQNEMLLRFQSEGWLSGFCIGKLNAYETIVNYLESYHKFPYLIKPVYTPKSEDSESPDLESDSVELPENPIG